MRFKSLAGIVSLCFLMGCSGTPSSGNVETAKFVVLKTDLLKADFLFNKGQKFAVIDLSNGNRVVSLTPTFAVFIDEKGCTTKNAAVKFVNSYSPEASLLWGAYKFKPETFCFE